MTTANLKTSSKKDEDALAVLKLLLFNSYIQQQKKANLERAVVICNYYGWKYKRQKFAEFKSKLKTSMFNIKQAKVSLLICTIEKMLYKRAFNSIYRRSTVMSKVEKILHRSTTVKYRLRLKNALFQMRWFQQYMAKNDQVIHSFVS